MNSVERLIKYFVPEHYDLALTLDEKNHTFTGSVRIFGNSVRENSPIKLHTKDLTITSAKIDDEPTVYAIGDPDTLTMSIDKLPVGEHTLTVEFSGDITDQMHGLYPCYFDVDGVKKELFATQFESHHAREVFPCIDEPEAKATFALELSTAYHKAVLSNMPTRIKSERDGKLVTTFETTPRMSTYLLAFVVGDLSSKSGKTKSGIEVNVWATPEHSQSLLDFPLDIAIRNIDFYEEYFDTAYPLPKSDHVALPDFSSGAMENWGLITYREMALLADKNTSIASRHYIATVIAHELAHMWFGNLVTMKWWNDLWLNESFATLMEYVAIDSIEPDWNIWLDFATSETVMALRRDAIDGVQAVQVDVRHPDEISTLFDGAIVYAKGARLLRMIQHYLGHDAFREGLKSYFNKYKFQNTEGNDLWNELAQASGKPVAEIMNTWISQSGFPVVSIVRGDEEITLTQHQFFVGPHAPSDKTWPIPLDSASNVLPAIMARPNITIPATDSLVLNANGTSHFITNYDDVSKQHLIDDVKTGNLSTIQRAQLLSEAVLLANGGLSSNSELIPLLDAYRGETLEAVWDMISLSIGNLKKFVDTDDQAEAALRKFAADIARDQYKRLGWNAQKGEPEEDTKLRSAIIGLMLYGEDNDAVNAAYEIFDSTPLEDIDPELRALVISSVVRGGDGQLVDMLLEAYRTTKNVELKMDINTGITSTRIPAKISVLLDALKDQNTIRPQDVFRWFARLVFNRESRNLAWQWVRDNWDWVVDSFEGDKNYEDFPRYIANGLKTQQHLDEYKDFFEPMLENAALNRAITIGITEIEGRVELIQNDGPSVVETLKKLNNL